MGIIKIFQKITWWIPESKFLFSQVQKPSAISLFLLVPANFMMSAHTLASSGVWSAVFDWIWWALSESWPSFLWPEFEPLSEEPWVSGGLSFWELCFRFLGVGGFLLGGSVLYSLSSKSLTCAKTLAYGGALKPPNSGWWEPQKLRTSSGVWIQN